MRNPKTRLSYIFLWTTAIIWGFAFVAQRMGMEFVGPFTFNGVRFALGALSLAPILYFSKSAKKSSPKQKSKISLIVGGSLAGVALFLGASLQQVGIVNTTAGNAGFITSLYVVITPLLGLIFKQRPTKQVWVGVVLATLGLYFLSVKGDFSMNIGDVYVLIGAFFFASHVLIIAWLSPQFNVLKISIIQFSVTSLLSMIIAINIEQIAWASIYSAAIPIIYGGVFSVGVAYTLQVAGQRNTKPALAAIILSFEALFAAIGGWFLLQEVLNIREILGCVLLLLGIIIAQLKLKKIKIYNSF